MKIHAFVLAATAAATASLQAKTVFEENFMQYADYAPRMTPDKGIRCGTDPIWKIMGQVDANVKAPCDLFKDNIAVPDGGFNVTCRFKLNAKQPKKEKNKETGEETIVEPGEASFFAPSPDVLCVYREKDGEASLAVVSRAEEERRVVCDFLKNNRGLTRDAYERLAAKGAVTARDLLSGKYDVIVADGFSGNVAVKSMEGGVVTVMKMMKKMLTSSFKNKMGAMLLKKSLMEFKDNMDYNKTGGAFFIGVNKVVVKAHGSSDRVAIKAAVLQAESYARAGLV